MRRFPSDNLVCVIFALLASTAIAQKSAQTPSAFEETKWQKGPAVVSMSSVAQIRLPKGYIFADAADTKRLMEAMETFNLWFGMRLRRARGYALVHGVYFTKRLVMFVMTTRILWIPPSCSNRFKKLPRNLTRCADREAGTRWW